MFDLARVPPLLNSFALPGAKCCVAAAAAIAVAANIAGKATDHDAAHSSGRLASCMHRSIVASATEQTAKTSAGLSLQGQLPASAL